ncbi:MAG: GNAT family N-acetyltransferase [Acholeplasmatales bacterium]|nr:GNAT family N-acetyltransferase [Acholeplasmatales bacterium]
MKIRIMTINDYAQVYNMWLSCVGMGFNNVDDSKEGIEKFLKRNPTSCFVAIEDDIVVGAVIAGDDGRRGYIYHLAVNPKYRKNGIGTSLVNNVMNSLEKLGINKVALLTFKRNEVANAFWEKQGFTTRDDINYRNKQIKELVRIDT